MYECSNSGIPVDLDYPGIIRFEARLSGFEEDYPVWIIRAHPGGNRIIKTPDWHELRGKRMN